MVLVALNFRYISLNTLSIISGYLGAFWDKGMVPHNEQPNYHYYQ